MTSDPDGQLIALATREFGTLLPAERLMLRAAAQGQIARCYGSVLPPQLPPPPEFVDEERLIRAVLLRWLCITRDAHACVSPRGIRVRGAVISGQLDLEHCQVPMPLWIMVSAIPEGINLAAAELRELSLDGSRVCGPRHFSMKTKTTRLAIDASQVRVAKSLSLAEGFSAVGEVRLRGATIEGQLNCRAARLEHPGRTSLSAEMISVGRDVFLDQGFTSLGEVRLVGAKVQGQLSCRGARIENPKTDKCSTGYALSADRLTVGGSVMLDRGFNAIGQVRLLGANISGQLDCGGSVLVSKEYCSLCADGIWVGGDVFLNEWSAPCKPIHRFVSLGSIRLIRGKIGGQLSLRGATLDNEGGVSLVADGLGVDGAVFLDEGFSVRGDLDFTSAVLRDHMRVHGAKINGRLLLTHATVAEQLTLQQSEIKLIGLSHASVTVLDDDAQSWPKAGNVNLDGFVYERLENPPTTAWNFFRRSWLEFSGWLNKHWSRVPPAKGPPIKVQSLDWRIEWLRRQGRYFPQPYEQLIRTLRVAGHESEARRVAVEKQADLRKCGDLWWWPWRKNWFLGLTLEHGYSPLRPAIAALIAIPLFWWAYSVGFAYDALLPVTDQMLVTGGVDQQEPHFSAFMYSVDAFVPLIDFGQEGAWRPTGDGGWGWFVTVCYWIEIGLGWIVSSLLVLGLSRVIRQD